MLKFTGNFADLPTGEVGAPNGEAFDDTVVRIDENGGHSVLAPAGVKVSREYYDAIAASVEPMEIEPVETEEKAVAPRSNKKFTPSENK